MISEEQQDQAALYVLGSLDADEANRFEEQMNASAALREFVQECLESSSLLALTAYPMAGNPPAGIKKRVMIQVTASAAGSAAAKPDDTAIRHAAKSKIIPFPRWVPWAIAAVLLLFCGLLTWRQLRLNEQNSSLSAALQESEKVPTQKRDPLRGLAVCRLEAPGGGNTKGQATVVWDASSQEGILQVAQLQPPTDGKDYQLWAVEDGQKEPVSAGLVHLTPQGQTTTVFRPAQIADNRRVLAFALSMEKRGGSTTNAGPIVLVGKL